MKTCCWVISPATKDKPAQYCSNAVKYTIQFDDDGNKKRVYNTFCDGHKAIADAQTFDENQEN